MTFQPKHEDPPGRHTLSGTELRRRHFRDEDGGAWEAVAAWDSTEDHAFTVPRIYFRSLSDPQTPCLLGPREVLWPLSDEELRSLLMSTRSSGNDPAVAPRAKEPSVSGAADALRDPEPEVPSGQQDGWYLGMTVGAPGDWLPDLDDSFELVEEEGSMS
jgi:hypothetical protein